MIRAMSNLFEKIKNARKVLETGDPRLEGEAVGADGGALPKGMEEVDGPNSMLLGAVRVAHKEGLEALNNNALTLARSRFTEATESLLQAGGKDTALHAVLLNLLGVTFRRARMAPEALAAFRGALEVDEQLDPADPTQYAVHLNNLAGLYQEMEWNDLAKPLMEQVVALDLELLGETHPQTGSHMNNLGCLLFELGEYEPAEHWLQRAVEVGEALWAGGNPQLAVRLSNLALVRQQQQKEGESERLLRESLAICETRHPPTSLQRAAVQYNLSRVLGAQSSPAARTEALKLAAEATRTLQGQLGLEHPQSQRVKAQEAHLTALLEG